MKPEESRESARGRSAGRWEWAVAARMIRSRGRGAFSAVSWTSMLGIILGVTSLVVVLSITGGFEKAFQERILGFHPHLVVLDSPSRSFEAYREAVVDLMEVPEVEAVSPSTYNEMLIAGRKGRTGISLKGLPLDGLQKLLEDGVEYEGDLGLLDDSLQTEWKDGELSYLNVVNGTSWTVLLPETGTNPVAVRDRGTRAEPGQSRLRIVNMVGEGRWLDVASERIWAPPAGVSRGIDLAPGPLVIDSMDESGKQWKVSLREGDTVMVVLGDDGQSALIVEGQYSFQNGRGHAAIRQAQINWQDEPLTASDYGTHEGRLPGVLLGYDLWKKLGVEKGEPVSLASPLRGIGDRMVGPMGMAPSSLAFQVIGWFKSGYFEYDSRMGVAEFRTVQRLLNRGDSILWLDVRFHELFELERKKSLVRAALDPYGLPHFLEHARQLRAEFETIVGGGHAGLSSDSKLNAAEALSNVVVASEIGRTRKLNFGYKPRYKLVTWEEMNANLFGALKLQKVVLTVFFLIIIAVAAFNVVGSQIMLIHDKRASIAILKAMGASEGGIMKVFLIQGGAVSAIGTVVGLALGLGICGLIDVVGYPLDAEVYLISQLPVEITPGLVAVVGVMAVVLTTITTLYSSGRASRMEPVDGLRHLD